MEDNEVFFTIHNLHDKSHLHWIADTNIYSSAAQFFIQDLTGKEKNALELSPSYDFADMDNTSTAYKSIKYETYADGWKNLLFAVDGDQFVKKIFFLAQEEINAPNKHIDLEILYHNLFFKLSANEKRKKVIKSRGTFNFVERKKICNLKIVSNYILIGGSPIEWNVNFKKKEIDVFNDTPHERRNNLFKKQQKPIVVKNKEREAFDNLLIIPAKNKNYPVYIYTYEYDEMLHNGDKAEFIVIEEIEDCMLNYDIYGDMLIANDEVSHKYMQLGEI